MTLANSLQMSSLAQRGIHIGYFRDLLADSLYGNTYRIHMHIPSFGRGKNPSASLRQTTTAVFCLLLVLALLACNKKSETVKVEPEYTRETATVIDVIRTPTTHGSSAKKVDVVDSPKQYAFVLECQHGQFVVQYPSPVAQWFAVGLNGPAPTPPKADPWWTNLRKGDVVSVFHTDDYRVDSNGRRHLVAHFAEMNATQEWAARQRTPR